jgi:hypothetical protein
MFQQDFLFVEYSPNSHLRYPASYERHFSGVPEIHIHEHERGAHESIEKEKQKKNIGVWCFVFVGFDMHAWWEAWRSSVPGCLVGSVLEHLVGRGIACMCMCMGGRVIQRLVCGGFGNS